MFVKLELLFSLLLIFEGVFVESHGNKYSEDANVGIKDLKDPLRMGKLNLIWQKAQKKLSEPKLRKLLSELKVQDHDEMTFKKLKASGGDKDGLREADLRKRLLKIMKIYGLEREGASAVPDVDDKIIEKSMFKDKKLHKLWLKAEQSGLSQNELKALREEFFHHQEKIDEYHMLIEKTSISANDVKSDILNDIHKLEEMEDMEGGAKAYYDNVNTIRQKHRELKTRYNDLHKKATSGLTSGEFSDPRVASLWKLAVRGDFSEDELESLYTELKHYETRLAKISHLSNELNKSGVAKVSDPSDEIHLSDDDREKVASADSTEARRILEQRLEKQRRKTEKLHRDLEDRILARHGEL